MPEFTTPDELDELDRRVYDLAVQPIPLAEIAVRLGVPVPQADEKLQRLFRRLGVEDRASLRAISIEPPPVPLAGDAAAEFVIGQEPARAVEEAGPAGRRFSRRAVLGAAAGVAVVAFAGGSTLGWRSRSGSSGTTDGPGLVPTGPAGGAPALNDGEFPLAKVAGLDRTFRAAKWAPSQPIDWSHGFFAVSTGTGEVSGYAILEPASGALPRYRAVGDGRFVVAEHGDTGWIIDREAPAEALRWDLARFALLEGFGLSNGPKYFVFESTSDAGRALHFVHDLGPSVVERAQTIGESPAPQFTTQVLKQPAGKRLAILTGGEAPALTVFDVGTGERLANYPLAVEPGTTGVVLGAPFLRLTDGFLARWMTTAGNAGGGTPQRFYAQEFSWDGRVNGPGREEKPGTMYAPDGLTAARESLPAERANAIPDAFPAASWASVEHLPPATGAPDFRLRSASLLYGDRLPPNRWLSDGSGFVVAVRGAAAGRVQYAIVRDADTPIEILPAPPAAGQEWYDNSWVCGPVPSPGSPTLLSFGRLHVYNLKSRQWFSAGLSGPGGPDHVDPWGGGPEEMVFALPHGGHGGSEPPPMLAPKFELPPFDDRPNLVVEVDPDGLNLRELPTVQSRSLALLHNGEQLTLIESRRDAARPDEVNMQRDGDSLWLFVRTASGLQGWVNSTWIAWA